MQAAYRRTGDMDGLLNQLFYVSKIETGNMPLSVQKIEIADFIRNYVNGKQELLDKEKEQMQAETGIFTWMSIQIRNSCSVFLTIFWKTAGSMQNVMC